MRCEFAEKELCYIPTMKICNEYAELCKRRKLLKRGMTQKQIDDLWDVPEKYRVKEE